MGTVPRWLGEWVGGAGMGASGKADSTWTDDGQARGGRGHERGHESAREVVLNYININY